MLLWHYPSKELHEWLTKLMACCTTAAPPAAEAADQLTPVCQLQQTRMSVPPDGCCCKHTCSATNALPQQHLLAHTCLPTQHLLASVIGCQHCDIKVLLHSFALLRALCHKHRVPLPLPKLQSNPEAFMPWITAADSTAPCRTLPQLLYSGQNKKPQLCSPAVWSQQTQQVLDTPQQGILVWIVWAVFAGDLQECWHGLQWQQ